VVKMYMRKVYLPHVFVGDAVILQTRGEPVEAVRRSGLDEGGGSSVLAEQEERGNDLLGIHEFKVYNLYLHLRSFGLWLQAEIIQTLFVRLPARLEKGKDSVLDLNLMRELSVKTDTKIVLLVVDGLGGLPMDPSGQTELEAADTPNLDALAARSDLGLSRPVAAGVSPGSGPGHLGLFGYDPVRFQVGRGVLSALGVGFDLGENDLAARVNFATRDESGKISDRRAGRIPSEKGEELVTLLNEKVNLEDVEVFVMPEKEYRAVAVFRGEGLSDALTDSDPQRTGLEPLPVEPTDGSPEAKNSARIVNSFVEQANEILGDHHPANTILVRGFGMHPALPSFEETYRLRAAAIASYPMYKGLARLAGMQLLKEGEGISGEFETLKSNWDDHDFFFVHIKPTDAAGEDGDFDRKASVIEEVDARIPVLLDLGPDALAVTGDHATPAKMKSHSWHGVPFLLASPYTLPTADNFGERPCAGGSLGVFQAEEIMGYLMGHAMKLNRFGA
jgi:2,3-bisphosphoglycerate-independent phosphoglycerate mutase